MSLNDKLLHGEIFVGSVVLGAAAESIAPGHGRDVAYCLSSYSGFQFMNCNLSPARSAAVASTVQSLGEVCQKHGLFPGTFDLKDFVAYAIGSTLVFGTERLIRHFKNTLPECRTFK